MSHLGENLTVSGDSLGTQNWGVHATGIWWVGIGDAVERPKLHRTALHNSELM